MERVKVVLDSDVLIHFAKANRLSMLPTILPEYDHVVLSTVYDELKTIQKQLDNQILYHAWTRGCMTKDECNEFIRVVKEKGSKLPNVTIEEYVPNVRL